MLAIGARPHSGWAVLVVAGGSLGAPVVVERRRVVLVDESLPRMVYHAVEALPLDEGARVVDQVTAATAQGTAAAVEALLDDLTGAGHEVAAAAIVGAPRRVPELAAIVRSHALLHSAEGELYRSALEEAFTAAGLVAGSVDPRLASGLAKEHADSLAVVGKALGPPWQKDHKEATVAALVALDSL